MISWKFWGRPMTKLKFQVLRKERRSTNVMEAFHRALLDVIEVAHPSMMSFIQDLWQVASVTDRDAALTAAGWNLLTLAPDLFKLYLSSCSKCETKIWF